MGVGRNEIAAKVGCSRQTVWRHLKDAPEPPAPTNGSAPVRPRLLPVGPTGGPDWNAIEAEAIGALRKRADDGSIGAAVQLSRLANQMIERNACRDHVPSGVVRELQVMQFDLWMGQLEGAFIRRVSLEFPEADIGRLTELVEGLGEDMANHINNRAEVVAQRLETEGYTP